MNRAEALSLIKNYSSWARDAHDVLFEIHKRFPEDGSENKAMRWLGFCQGVLLERGVFRLDDLKNHSMKKSL